MAQVKFRNRVSPFSSKLCVVPFKVVVDNSNGVDSEAKKILIFK